MAEIEQELKSLLIMVKRRVKSWLKTQHSKNEDNGFWDQIDLQWNLKYSITRANYNDGNGSKKVPGVYQHTKH